jgi:hypothetical protein
MTMLDSCWTHAGLMLKPGGKSSVSFALRSSEAHAAFFLPHARSSEVLLHIGL